MRLKSIPFSILFSLILLVIFSSFSFACSTFMINQGDSFIVGHNLDQITVYEPGYIFVNKRGVTKTNFTENDLLGKPNPTAKLQWTSKYGSITFNPFGREFPDGGINEAGLYVAEMTLMWTKYPESKSRPHMIVPQWIQYQLDNYQSVDEVLKNKTKIVPELNFLLSHFFISDKYGHYACIEFIEGEPVVYTDKSMPVPVLCNGFYSEEMNLLKEYEGFGGTRNIYNNIINDNRFAQATYMINKYQPNQSKPIVGYGFEILKQIGNGNKWSTIVDVKNSTVYFHTSRCRDLKYFCFKNFNFSTSSPVEMIDINSNLSGDVTKQFATYTFSRNKELISETLRVYDKLVYPELKEYFVSNGTTVEEATKRLACYPDTTKSK
jgi:penicillin V acylase-like amidase (Ntn superfamily)